MKRFFSIFVICVMCLSVWGQDVNEQCELTLEIGSNAFLDNIENPSWLEMYAGDAEWPFWTYWRESCSWCYEEVSIPVAAGVPLRVVWHEPDPVNHEIWFSLYDPSQQRMIAYKYNGDELFDGEIATYTPDCGASCTEKCPLQISMTRTPGASSSDYMSEYSVDGMFVGWFALEPTESRLDTTLWFCPDRRVEMWTYSYEEDNTLACTITDAYGNVTERG